MTNSTNKTNSVGSGELANELRNVAPSILDFDHYTKLAEYMNKLITDQKLSLLAELEEKAVTMHYPDDDIKVIPLSVIKSKEEELK